MHRRGLKRREKEEGRDVRRTEGGVDIESKRARKGEREAQAERGREEETNRRREQERQTEKER